ncbi:MAG: ATP-binding protein [Cloacibacillus sp.]
MAPAPKQHGLNYSLLTQTIGKDKIRALSSAVVYGPNASGKTNLIGAMETLKEIISRGNIKNAEIRNMPNAASSSLELIPNRHKKSAEPVDFSLKFTEAGMLFDYALSLNLGKFMQTSADRWIDNESLSINHQNIFSRRHAPEGEATPDTLAVGTLETINRYLPQNLADNKESAEKLAAGNLNSKELFLTNGFKNIFSQKIVNIITEWLAKKFITVYRADLTEILPNISAPAQNTVYVDNLLNKAVKIFGLGGDEIGYTKSDDNPAVLSSAFGAKSGKMMPAELFESYGTVRFATVIYPLVVTALSNGGVLVADEFDASIHPMALMSIINAFHNDEVNIHNAQLIFNTHNPVFLNANLFRRDEIKFVERGEETENSILYSLSDFKTSGTAGVRKGENYLKSYFISKYGAIKEIDFSDIFKEALEQQEGEGASNDNP